MQKRIDWIYELNDAQLDEIDTASKQFKSTFENIRIPENMN